MLEAYLLSLSWPLRMMATVIAVAVVNLFDPSVTHDLTTIRLGSANYVITDACSGIEQLGGMLLIGAAIAWYQQRHLGRTVFQYAFIVPCIVLANAARIIVTVIAFRIWGEAAFADTPHVVLGWLQTALALGLFALVGFLIARVYRTSPEEKA